MADVMLLSPDACMRRSLRRLLAGAGYAVIEAGSVADAVASSRNAPGALVLMDDAVAVERAPEAVRRMTAAEPRLRIVVIAAAASEALTGEVRDAGAAACAST